MNNNTISVVKYITCLFGLLAMALPAQAASFDCTKATAKVEKLICGDAELSKLDDDLITAYKAALQDAKQADSIKQAQKQWVRKRNRCDDAVCVLRGYKERLLALREIGSGAKATKAGKTNIFHTRYVIDGEGEGEPFCEAILSALNKTKPTNDFRPCISEEVLKLPGVSDPEWHKLDLSQHEDLAKKMIVLDIVGSTEYFRKEKVMPQIYPTPLQQQAEFDVAEGAGAELFTLQLSPELFGDRVLAILRHKNDMCGWPIQLSPVQYRGERQHSAWVTSDLKEIATAPGDFDSRAGRPVMYGGHLYLIRFYGGDQELEVYVPRHGYISRVCNMSIFSVTNNKGEAK